MELIIPPDAQAVACRAADIVCDMMAHKADAVLGLATGSTPVPLYRELVSRYQSGKISFSHASSFNLDEYVGLPPGSPHSFRQFMQEQLFGHIDLAEAHAFMPTCRHNQDPRQVGPAYERLIQERGGIDLQILGIGRNGHIGFNEPGSSLGSRTRLKTLAMHTRRDNLRSFEAEDRQPVLAITMGIATILEARRIVLLATGENKAQAIADAVEGPLAAIHPASALQLHQHVRVIIDEAAASRLINFEYYQDTFAKNESIIQRHGEGLAGDPWFTPNFS